MSSLLAITSDEELDIALLDKLLDRVAGSIHDSQNRVRYTMNGFVIAAGSFVARLTDRAMNVGEKIGKVSVEMGGTACKVPLSVDYIIKVKTMGKIGNKKKVARC